MVPITRDLTTHKESPREIMARKELLATIPKIHRHYTKVALLQKERKTKVTTDQLSKKEELGDSPTSKN